MRVGNFELFSFPNEPLAQSLNTLRAGDSIAYNFDTAVAESDDLLPEGLDGHRYRCCGNGVVAPVAEWIGRRILAVDAKHYKAGA
jgi:site-specific DNA-cytosine methylase